MMRRAGWVTLVALAATALAGCAASTEGDGGEPAASEAPARFAIDADFPDPDVLTLDDGYVAFATGTHGLNVQVATSPDLEEWTVQRRDALPKLPAWASPGRTWAPEVSAGPDGGLIMYVTAEDTASGRQCIGVATSPSVEEPFVAASDVPIVCPVDAGGAIDASTFDAADGTRYLLWKTDGNCCSLPTWIEMAPLSADGLSLAGDPMRLIQQDLDWEGTLVEAPVLVEHDGRFALFSSANDYGGEDYAVGVAYADALTGPYVKQPEPLLTTQLSDGTLRGPGGQDVVHTPDGDRIVFHSWDEQFIYRGLNVRPLEWTADGAKVVLD